MVDSVPEIFYQIPAGVQASYQSGCAFLSTPHGGKVLVDRRVIDLWQKADQARLATILKTLTVAGYSEAAIRAALACLCQAGFLKRPPEDQAERTLTPYKGPLVSVIIVSYNSQPWLAECLSSLAAQSYPAVEIILVDNHSSDNTAAWTRTNHPDIRLIQLDQTVSLSQAINTGIQAAQGDYFLLLNADVRLDPDALSILVQTARSEQDVAAVAAKLILSWTPGFLNGIGNLVGAFGFGADIGLGHLDLGQFDQLTHLPSACFAAALLSRQAWEDIGPLDPGFPLYYEDSEWCYRARLLGYSILAAPKAIVYHAFGSRTSTSQDSSISPNRLQRVVYGRLRFAGKLLGNRYRPIFMRRYLLEDTLRFIYAAIRWRRSQAKAIWQGRRQFNLADDLPEAREALQKKRKMTDEELLGLQRRLPAPLVWRGLPVLTWNTIQSVYTPLIIDRQTIPLPEFPVGYLPTQSVSSRLLRWKQIYQDEGAGMLTHRLYRAIQGRLAQP